MLRNTTTRLCSSVAAAVVLDETVPQQPPPPVPRPGVVFNPFTRRMVASDSKFVQDMQRGGFSINTENPLVLSLSDPSKLSNFCKRPKKLNKKASVSSDDDVATTQAPGSPLPEAAASPPAKKKTLTWRQQVEEFVGDGADLEEAATRLESFMAQASDMRANAYLPTKLVSAAEETSLAAGVELTGDQQNVVNLALQGLHMYIGGSAGTGKTIALRAIATALRAKGLNVVATATTGVAAVHLGGTTLHNAFSVPIKPGQKWDVNALRAADAVIIDEVSLLDLTLFEAFDAKARFYRLNNQPFGGMQVILCGDFLQLSMDRVTETPCYKSTLFNHFVSAQLTTPMRQRDLELLSVLGNLRNGQYDERLARMTAEPEDLTGATFLFPKRMHATMLNDERLAAVDGEEHLYHPHRGALITVGANLSKTAIVSNLHGHSHRRILDATCDAMKIDREEITAMPCKLQDDKYCIRARLPLRPSAHREFQAHVEKAVQDVGGVLSEWALQPPESAIPYSVSMSLAENTQGHAGALRLKVGCRVMVVRNLSNTICNGSIGVIEAFAEPDRRLYPEGFSRQLTTTVGSRDKQPYKLLPIVKLQTGERIQIPPVSDVVGGTNSTYFYGHEVSSIPLALGYAFTVHKVQGLTLNGKVVVDCSDMFNCEHLIYVACSRVRHMDQLTVKNIEPSMVQVRDTAMDFAASLPSAAHTFDVPADATKADWYVRDQQATSLAA